MEGSNISKSIPLNDQTGYFQIYKTKKDIKIMVSKGTKTQSPFDFRVHYKEPSKRVRTPKHVHIIIDLYMKLSRDRELTMKLVDHIIENIIKKVQPATKFPPILQIFSEKQIHEFSALDNYGEYSVDFILPVCELIMIQEKTNYPTGILNLRLFEKFRRNEDIFSVVSAATFNRK
jgi:hypothetical protein